MATCHISEFRRHPTDPDLADVYTERILLTIVKPWENHNGGMLQFGPDGTCTHRSATATAAC